MTQVMPLSAKLAADLSKIVLELRRMNSRTSKPIVRELAPYIVEIRELKYDNRERLAG